VIPSNPYDAKGMLLSAIRDDDPILFFEPKRVYRSAKGEVPAGEYLVPLGKAAIPRPGKHLTLISWGAMVWEAMEAAQMAAEKGIDVEVIDLRSLLPLDLDAVIASVKKTGRVVIVHEAARNNGFGSELVALINEHAFTSLEAPPKRVTGWDVPFPYTLEMEYLPRSPRILMAIEETRSYIA